MTDHKITLWFNRERGVDGVRATYFGPHGTSTKTCNTHSEAMQFVYTCRNRKRAPTPDLSYRNTRDYIEEMGKWKNETR